MQVGSEAPTGMPPKRAARRSTRAQRQPFVEGEEVPELAAYEELISELEEETEKKSRAIAELQAEMSQKDARIRSLEAELAQKDQRLSGVSRRLDRLEMRP